MNTAPMRTAIKRLGSIFSAILVFMKINPNPAKSSRSNKPWVVQS